ncbi:hypothetical protein LQ757_18590 [Agromyces sp. SYSU K20354]|uniref:hypothetical protein n=1 Tax=Agromyces cavernae TaxID=2898659 RepID=UPI001E616CB6|nr:hypothetical protein [Agromyces cavernae]MCD2444294.1 hypothetical protein [Agromyces cavernae]
MIDEVEVPAFHVVDNAVDCDDRGVDDCSHGGVPSRDSRASILGRAVIPVKVHPGGWIVDHFDLPEAVSGVVR